MIQNPAHLHLILNHAPLIGFGFGVLLLVISHLWKSKDLLRGAQIVLFVSALLTIPVYLSGEPAEEIVEQMPGMNDAIIHEHEDAALWGMISVQLTGLLALAGLIFSRGNRVPLKPLAIANLVVALWAIAVLVRVNNLGGQIHHPEIRSGFVAQTEAETETEQEHDEDD